VDENTKILWLLGLVYFLYRLFENVKEIKAGNEKKKDFYDDDSGLWFDQKSGFVTNLVVICFLVFSYVLINYFGFK
tara:strand:+ start:52 stop:279 length:228 start_codon:yes stop_codon:yes gene_type:complete